ncbi:MAG: hypothetical protein ACXIUW_14180 [Roseinatronobacter sp.]
MIIILILVNQIGEEKDSTDELGAIFSACSPKCLYREDVGLAEAGKSPIRLLTVKQLHAELVALDFTESYAREDK